MSFTPHDPRDIPVLNDAIDSGALQTASIDLQAAQSAIVTETMRIADALLHQAAKDMEVILFERVHDRLRQQLPDLVERILREHVEAAKANTAAT
jgi:Zn-dependent M32 family carboxypeptidase